MSFGNFDNIDKMKKLAKIDNFLINYVDFPIGADIIFAIKVSVSFSDIHK